ncbi:MAG: zf-HC2 domain-containing protein [Bacteroidetes bacterium]|nr:zf-HC2 domain-containing protein [Bacteroidota bacterium]MCW5896010.1 zf-HC2 domain-containing protein [Bacteroidota bacterium]
MHADETHWTDDSELIERFVLNELNPEERNELEDHLRICEVCKKAVRAEQMLIAGIRRGGREAFKSRLKQRVGALPGMRTPWVHIMSAAALVVIITGIGIYNRWFQSLETSGDVVMVLPPTSDSALTESTSPSGGLPELQSQPQSGATAVEPRILRDKQTEPTQPAMATKASPAAIEKTGKDEEHTVSESKAQHMQARAGRVATSSEGDLAMAESPAEVAGEDVVWLQGIAVPQPRPMVGGVEPANVEMRAKQKDPRQLDGPAKRVAKSDQTQGTKSPTAEFSFKQQPIQTLPPDQLRQLSVGSTRVVARIEQITNTTQLTLYLDQPLDEQDLAQIIAETPAPDSLVVHVRDQRFIFILPAGWETTLQRRQMK